MMRGHTLVLLACLGCGKSEQAKPAPNITGMIPDIVTPRGYRVGMIDGTGFDTTKPVKVFFGTEQSPRAVVASKTKVQAEVPPGKAGTEVEIRVEIEGYAPAIAPKKLKYDEGREDPDGQSHAPQ